MFIDSIGTGLGNTTVNQTTNTMLELRSNCEYCDTNLSTTSTAARIWSYERTLATHAHMEPNDASGKFVVRVDA